jgi:hypothetical protein
LRLEVRPAEEWVDCICFFGFFSSFLLPSLPGLCYFMKEIVSRTDVAFCIYARSIVPIK